MSKSEDEEPEGEMGLESMRGCLGLLFGARIVWKGLEDMWKKVEKVKDDVVGEREKNSRLAIFGDLSTHFFSGWVFL